MILQSLKHMFTIKYQGTFAYCTVTFYCWSMALSTGMAQCYILSVYLWKHTHNC